MSATTATEPLGSDELDVIKQRLRRYGCEAYELAGSGDSLYERHLAFDNAVGAAALDPRERFEAFARAVRDVLSQRWLKIRETYTRQNPKRIYYLSMEFLIGRSLANNVMNLLLDPVVRQAVKDDSIDWLSVLEQEPDAGLGNGGLGRLAACFLDSMATMQLPATDCGTSTGSSNNPSGMAGKWNSRTIGCAARTLGRWRARTRRLK